ncbi:DeoR family transcriptional regulator, partial [Ochrobactrum sp. POC9]
MRKQEKLTKILEIVNSKGTITVKQIMDEIA